MNWATSFCIVGSIWGIALIWAVVWGISAESDLAKIKARLDKLEQP